jgi:arsenite methyltransferase
VDKEKIKKIVRDGYARVAKQEISCCSAKQKCGCGTAVPETISKKLGYSDEEIHAVPEGANLGLGCGNPIALAGLKKGQTVLDLGSGAGFDCFLAARAVGATGHVIGVDMTAEMIEKARNNAIKGNYRNVEFRLGEIENLPVDSNSVDVIISNCVINLVPGKKCAFREAYRVLKSGGKLMVSDIVLVKELPPSIKHSVEAYIGCLSGAIFKNAYLKAISDAGFKDVRIIQESVFPLDVMANDPTAKSILDKPDVSKNDMDGVANSVTSIKVSAVK